MSESRICSVRNKLRLSSVRGDGVIGSQDIVGVGCLRNTLEVTDPSAL